MELQHINLNDLKPAAVNVRKKGGKDVSDLIPSIRSLGVLQPLLVRPNCEGFEIVAGQRRFHALTELAEESEADPVPCIVMEDGDDAKAIEASLAENITRLPMDEIDQFKAFAALEKLGGSVEDIASQFGVTERLVTQRLAIANLISPILTAYRKDEIDPQTVRILTMATKAQQKKWVELLRSDDERAPEGYRLKCWLFGGVQISTEVALFDEDEYAGNIVSDLFGEERYFDDPESFWAAQNTAIAATKDACLAEGWGEVIVLDIGERFASWEYVDTDKGDGGKVYVSVAHNGEVTVSKGQLSRKDIKARDKAKAGEVATPAKPEITKAMQNYLGLHRHASVRSDIMQSSGTALRLITAHMLAGSSLWRIQAERQRAEKDATVESLAANPAQQRFIVEREAVAGLLGIKGDNDLVQHADAYVLDFDMPTIFGRLVDLSDDDVTRVLTYLMAETLEAHTPMIEALGQHLETDPMIDWSPDEAFVDLLRDKQVINAMVGELAGDAAAKGNITATAKVQKGILKDCISGKREACAKDWRPRYMAFPMSAYTDRGGIAAIEAAESLKAE